MEQEKLIKRKTDKNDLRKSYIYLTEKGRECEKLFISKCQETEKVMFDGFSDDEMKILKEYLKKIANNLINDMEENR